MAFEGQAPAFLHKDGDENAEIRSENGLYTIKVLDTMQNVNILSNNAFSILSKIEKQFANKTNQLAAAPYFENEKEETAKSMKEIGIAVALGLIFGLLIFLFNSYIHAIIVLSVTPFIGVGLVIGLTVMRQPLSNMAIIGAVSLLGVVVNDSIVMLDFYALTSRKMMILLLQ